MLIVSWPTYRYSDSLTVIISILEFHLTPIIQINGNGNVLYREWLWLSVPLWIAYFGTKLQSTQTISTCLQTFCCSLKGIIFTQKLLIIVKIYSLNYLPNPLFLQIFIFFYQRSDDYNVFKQQSASQHQQQRLP